MKYPPKKVFILENGDYVEITYDELRWRTEHDITYSGRKFLPLHGMLMEVTIEDYKAFYREDEQQKYMARRSIQNGDLSIDGPLSEDTGRALIDAAADVGEMVEHKIMLELLKRAISCLNRDEQLLIFQYYYAELPEKTLAEMYGISQQAISKRIDRIRRKLKEIIE